MLSKWSPPKKALSKKALTKSHLLHHFISRHIVLLAGLVVLVMVIIPAVRPAAAHTVLFALHEGQLPAEAGVLFAVVHATAALAAPSHRPEIGHINYFEVKGHEIVDILPSNDSKDILNIFIY